MPISPKLPHADWCEEQPCGCTYWRRRVSADIYADLAGTADVADALGVPRQTLNGWRTGRCRPGTGFPAPVAQLASTPIWSISEVRDWFDRVVA